MYLLDTDVVSALRRPERHPRAAGWFQSHQSYDKFISVITFGEMERGIRMAERNDLIFAQHLTSWRNRVLLIYGDNVLPVHLPTARIWGRLSASIGNTSPDLFIAATALEHDLIVVTRNVRHFEPTGVRLVNPFDV